MTADRVTADLQVLDFGEELFASSHQSLCSGILLEVNLRIATFVGHVGIRYTTTCEPAR